MSRGTMSWTSCALRGGSWRFVSRFARLADRLDVVPGDRRDRLGLRLVRRAP